jgi:hypothetical protein
MERAGGRGLGAPRGWRGSHLGRRLVGAAWAGARLAGHPIPVGVEAAWVGLRAALRLEVRLRVGLRGEVGAIAVGGLALSCAETDKAVSDQGGREGEQ